MAAVKPKGKSKVTRKKTSTARGSAVDRSFMTALQALEEMARGQITSAKDPFKTGIRIVGEIKKVILRLENEIEDDSRSMTEAYDSGPGVVGMGIGVL
ncbi:MAG TPA: hypothetical protein PKN85_02680 [Syntrophorhabdaceae bacterium]|nr:hypothetical protein [Syntrophorhabdaceae bacterium]HOD76078.1 hypothetical protein [Syntrophorhabdaceae bacterium]